MIFLMISNFLVIAKDLFEAEKTLLTYNCLSGPRGLLPVQEQRMRNEFCVGTMIFNRFSRV